MKIEIISDKTVKVELSQADMKQFSLTYEEMDYQKPVTKKAIAQLLADIDRQTHFNIASSRLFIEAFPDADGGCILYVNLAQKMLSEGKNSCEMPLVFAFDSFDQLERGCKAALERCVLINDSLFRYKGRYVLTVETYPKLGDGAKTLLEEFGSLIGKGKLSASILQEHASLLVKEHAMQTVTQPLL